MQSKATLRTRLTAIFLAVVLCPPLIARASPPSWQHEALAHALQGTQASAIVLDIKTGAVLDSIGAGRRGAPGSVLKPLLLNYALQHGIVQPQMEVYCRRDLHIGGRPLPCTHPKDEPVFTAETALAESCNTWFAEMARRFSGPDLDRAMQSTHLQHASLLHADVTQRQLATLGLQGVSASTFEIARAYRDLFTHASPGSVVTRGLRGSVQYGMANHAKTSGLDILGKTGTASDPGEAWTHGWFAGGIPNSFILVVYVPHGDGGTAATLAQKYFAAVAAQSGPH